MDFLISEPREIDVECQTEAQPASERSGDEIIMASKRLSQAHESRNNEDISTVAEGTELIPEGGCGVGSEATPSAIASPGLEELGEQKLTLETEDEFAPNTFDSNQEVFVLQPEIRGKVEKASSTSPTISDSTSQQIQSSKSSKLRICWKTPAFWIKFTAWRSRREVVLWLAFASVFFVFVTNAILTMVAQFHLAQEGPDKYIRTVYTGDCGAAKRASIVLHLVINLLGTLMLSSSNLCLQLIGSPTRKQVDTLHRKGIWVDIGVLSFRNFKYLPRWSQMVWCLLSFSSLTVHFLYNSVVFSAFNTNTYGIAVIHESFLDKPFSNDTLGAGQIVKGSSAYSWTYASPTFYPFITSMNENYRSNPQAYQNLSTLDCLLAYHNNWIWRPNLLMVTSDPRAWWGNYGNGSLLAWVATESFTVSLCERSSSKIARSGRCSSLSSWTEEDARNWTYSRDMNWSNKTWHVDYCLMNPTPSTSEQIEQKECHLQCSPTLLLVVTIFNALKVLCILWVIYSSREPTLCTLGDAIASFLEVPDEVTENFGLADKESIAGPAAIVLSKRGETFAWKPKSNRWWRASTKSRWITAAVWSLLVLFLGCYAAGDGIYVQKIYTKDISIGGLWRLGFGSAYLSGLISWNQLTRGQPGLLENIILTNGWQVLLSILFVVLNSLMSSMLVADEWSGFASTRKTLRVSYPKEKQRSTYFISMPYRYAVPIMAVFILMHWLLSQTAFVVRVNQFNWTGGRDPGWTTSGYSIMPSLCSIVLGIFIMAAWTLIACLRKYPVSPGIPLVSTCSLAISANCHKPRTDNKAHLLSVQWGIYEKNRGDEGIKCSFSSHEVYPPEIGQPVFGLAVKERLANKDRPRRGLFLTCWKFFQALRKDVNPAS